MAKSQTCNKFSKNDKKDVLSSLVVCASKRTPSFSRQASPSTLIYLSSSSRIACVFFLLLSSYFIYFVFFACFRRFELVVLATPTENLALCF